MYLEESGREKDSSAQHEAMIINDSYFDEVYVMLCPLSSVQRPASQWTPTGPDAKPQNPGPGTGLQGSSLQRPVQVGLAQLVVRHPLNHLDKRGPCIQLSRSSGRVIKSRRTRRPPRRPAKHNSRRIAPSHRPFPVASHKTRRCLEPTRLTRILPQCDPARDSTSNRPNLSSHLV